jgi:hypothetical protein
MEKKTLATAAVASTLGGALAGATFLAPGFAGAQDDTGTEADSETTETETADEARPEAGERIAETLQALVDDGTLTQAQLDAVVDTLVEARPDGLRGHRGQRGGFGGIGNADLAGVLGLESSDLREALVDGQTLAEIAAEQGVATEDLVDALVDAAEERVATALENERIDQERADEILAEAAEKAEDLVNGELEFEGRRGFGGRHGGFGGGDESTPETDADA